MHLHKSVSRPAPAQTGYLCHLKDSSPGKFFTKCPQDNSAAPGFQLGVQQSDHGNIPSNGLYSRQQKYFPKSSCLRTGIQDKCHSVILHESFRINGRLLLRQYPLLNLI